jgi:hypothetical protein
MTMKCLTRCSGSPTAAHAIVPVAGSGLMAIDIRDGPIANNRAGGAA